MFVGIGEPLGRSLSSREIESLFPLTLERVTQHCFLLLL